MDARHSSLASAVGAQYISMPVYMVERPGKKKKEKKDEIQFVMEEWQALVTEKNYAVNDGNSFDT